MFYALHGIVVGNENKGNMDFDPVVNRVWNPNAESEYEELNEAGRLRSNMHCQLDAHYKAILNSLESFTVEHLRTGAARSYFQRV